MTGVKVGITGCLGRMGQALITDVMTSKGAVVAGGSEAPGHPAVGQKIGHNTNLLVLGDAKTLFDQSDVVIDFTRPGPSMDHTRLAAQSGTSLILGTTGFTAGQEQEIADLAGRTPIVKAANFSLGVNLLLSLVEKAAASLDEDFDIEILELHHRHKLDSPSGTALALGQAAAKGRNTDFDAAKILSRKGIGAERSSGSIGFASLRGGDVAGEHTVIFAGTGERIELIHKAADRAIFARGAVTAALWAKNRPAGLYSMNDVLGL